MQDEPAAPEILAAVAAFLRDTVAPQTTPLIAYQARVAANAVDLVARQWTLAPASDSAELEGLRALLGRDGSLSELNAALAEALADGTIAAEAAAPHLRATILAKLAVDQPKYSGYLAALAEKDA
ncbi:DUF6285 domain-containing protein [Glacieibacterium frigidum]|uniref:DUF6285 domain-containing protein n=1 Tax=Glacieibacterium frigidum TaxID=2593303 RepID=A0A552U8W1_9SPHN|nr:DUF6285 domain-containing protein [Glacieibacterium frigidum]TRW14619.1 hypothetical protein FMM06_13055 [Glacieibacterium frigidum]